MIQVNIRPRLRALIILVVAILVVGLSMFLSASPALAGTDDYPTSITGCHYVNNPGGAPFTCDLKNSAADTLIDPWNEYNRECTSFAAWRLRVTNNYDLRGPITSSNGEGGAAAWGLVYSNITNSTPSAGSIAWWHFGYNSGHVAWVRSVNGGNVTIEEYNYNDPSIGAYPNSYNERTTPASSVSGFIHFADIPPPFPNLTIQSGQWYERQQYPVSQTETSFVLGQAGDVPLVGDWDGNGSKTPGVFRPSTTEWFLSNSPNGSTMDYHLTFATFSDIPVVGNWDGVGGDSIGVYRASNNTWYLSNSNTSPVAATTYQYGSSGNAAAVGNWAGGAKSTPSVFNSGVWHGLQIVNHPTVGSIANQHPLIYLNTKKHLNY